jgi:hypothetical protein
VIPALKKIIPGSAFFLTLVLFLFSPALPAANSPWEIEKGEKMIEGILLSLDSERVRIKTFRHHQDFPLAPDALLALMGRQSGRLVSHVHFPTNIEVELYINASGAVRAIRNRQVSLKLPEGAALQGWGHQALLSPDGQYYLLYHRETGLHLYSKQQAQPSAFLAGSPTADWNASGEIALGLPDKIMIYNPRKKTKKNLPLPALPKGTSRVITALKWNCAGNKLFYVAVEDVPDTGSDLCSLAVMDKNGCLLGSKPVANLGPAVWLKNDRILYISYENMDGDRGRIMLWDYLSEQEEFFWAGREEDCTGLAYNPKTEVLAFTAKKFAGESLYLLKANSGKPVLALSWPFPLRNLQWSPGGALFFWDEYNNCVYELQNEDQLALPRAAGYLPPAGTGKDGFVYFLSEPLEEPQQPFFKQ